MRRRSFRPSYLLRRLAQIRFQRAHPDAPWLGPNAIYLLDNWLRPSDVGFEWGSGRSTLWLAQRSHRLTSVEHDPQWHAQVTAMIAKANLDQRVDYRHIPCLVHEMAEPDAHPYADAITDLADESLDFVMVDGMIRLSCIRRALSKLKPGGLLGLDNANRYVPNRLDGGHTTIHEPRDQPRTPAWQALLADLADWRWINTSDGIWDTRFWVKPAN